MLKRCRTVLFCAHGVGVSVTGLMYQLKGRVPSKRKVTSVRSLQNYVSIFGLPTKHRHFGASERAVRTPAGARASEARKKNKCSSLSELAKQRSSIHSSR